MKNELNVEYNKYLRQRKQFERKLDSIEPQSKINIVKMYNECNNNSNDTILVFRDFIDGILKSRFMIFKNYCWSH